MPAGAAAGHGGRAVRAAALLAGALLVGYAISDHPLYGGEPGFDASQTAIAALGALVALAALAPLAWTKRVLLVLFTLLFMLALAEVVLEKLLSARLRPPFQYDSRVIFTTRPDRYHALRRQPINGGDRILARFNQAGYRGDELLPRGKQLRVLAYGDSFIHALYTSDDAMFTEQLEQRLARALTRQVEVINAAVASYGPDQVLLRMPQELAALKPDLIVLGVFANDFGDLERNKLFRLNPDGSLRRNAFRLADDVRRSFELSQNESIVKRALKHALAPAMRAPGAGAPGGDPNEAWIDDWLKTAADEHRSYVSDDVVTNVYRDVYAADVSLLPNAESSRARVQLMDAVLGEIQRTADRAEVPLVLLFIPHPMDVEPGYAPGPIDPARFPDYRPTNVTGALRHSAERHGSRYFDLFDVYAQRDADELYFHGGDDHWNDAGQAVAAQALSDFLVGSGLVRK